MKNFIFNKTATVTSIVLAVGLSCGMVLSANTVTPGPVNSGGGTTASHPATTVSPVGESFSETVVVADGNTHEDIVKPRNATPRTPETRVPNVEPGVNVNTDVIQPTTPGSGIKRNTTPVEQTPVTPRTTSGDKGKTVIIEPETKKTHFSDKKTNTETPVIVEPVVEETTPEPETTSEDIVEEIIVETNGADAGIGEPSSFAFVSASPEVINAYYNGDYSGIERNTTPSGLSSISYTPTIDGYIEIKWSSGAYHATVTVSSDEDVTNFVQFVNTVLQAMAYQN